MSDHIYLAHHGIKGMKWGVRRFQNKDGTLTSAGRKRYDIDEHRVLAETAASQSKHGANVELSSVPSSRVAKFLAAHNKKIRSDAEKTRNYTIKANGKSVGEMTLYKESDNSLNVVWVDVDKSSRGQGYATAAMIGAIGVAKKAGCTQVTLEVPGDSPDARHIYEKLGFVAQKQLTSDDVWGGLTAMKLDLSTANVAKHSACTSESPIDHIFLAHHGIKGQKWGVRRFQNKDGTLTAAGKERYDLSSSASVSKDTSLSNRHNRRAKQIAKGAAIAAGVLLAAYGGYKLSQLQSKETSTGSSVVDGFLRNTSGRTSPAIGRSIGDIDRTMVSKINRSNGGPEGEINCAHTSMAYILNSVFGENVQAQGFSGVDEASGLVRKGRSKKIFDAAFDGIQHIQPPSDEMFEQSVERIPKGSTGVLYVHGNGLAHFLNYERDAAGAITLVDTQQRDSRSQIIPQGSQAYGFLSQTFGVNEILDFSNASISNNAGDVFKYCVKGD